MLYAVLALLSERYPPTKGRLSTCYAPVRHFQRVAPLLVRLACVRRAANVRSEPGSNSPVIKTVEHQLAVGFYDLASFCASTSNAVRSALPLGRGQEPSRAVDPQVYACHSDSVFNGRFATFPKHFVREGAS